MQPNGVRYLRVGGRRGRRFVGISFQPRNLPENAATPTRRVHAVLGGFYIMEILQVALNEHLKANAVPSDCLHSIQDLYC